MWTKVFGLLFGPPCTSHSGSGYTVVTTRTIAGDLVLSQRPTSMCMSGIAETMQQNSIQSYGGL